MILTLKKFFVNKDNDYEKMASRVGAHRIFLENILAGNVPNEEYPLDQLVLYCRSLIDGQRAGVPGLPDGSWSVSPDPSGVSEEDCMDYHFFPTLIAISLLTLCAGKYPEEIGTLPGLEKALERGYAFILTGNLEGFGFNSLFQQVESILILGSGGCPAWLASHPDASPALVERLREIGQSYKNRLEKGDTLLSFGGDYKPQFALALKSLQPLME
jgi:hypothetical protein